MIKNDLNPHEIAGRHVNENEYIISEKSRPCLQVAVMASLVTAMGFVVLILFGALSHYADIVEKAMN